MVAEAAGVDPNLCKGGVGLLPCGPSVVGRRGVGGGGLLAGGVAADSMGRGRVGTDGVVGLCGYGVGVVVAVDRNSSEAVRLEAQAMMAMMSARTAKRRRGLDVCIGFEGVETRT